MEDFVDLIACLIIGIPLILGIIGAIIIGCFLQPEKKEKSIGKR